MKPKRAVTGRVMCGDKPAAGGVITFQPIDAPEKTGRPKGNPGGVSRAIVAEDGTFRLTYEVCGVNDAEDGAVTGPHRVIFIPPITEPLKWNSPDDWLPEDEKAEFKEELAKQTISSKLPCVPEISPSDVEVQDGTNDFDFQLQALIQTPDPSAVR